MPHTFRFVGPTQAEAEAGHTHECFHTCLAAERPRRRAEEYEYWEVVVMRHSPTCRVVQRMSGARSAELLRRNGGEKRCTTQQVGKLRPW